MEKHTQTMKGESRRGKVLTAGRLAELVDRLRTRLDVALGIEFFLLLVWIFLAYVDGMSRYVIHPSIVLSTGWSHALGHMLWLGFPLLVWAVGSSVTKFRPSPTPEESLQSARGHAVVYLVILPVSMLVHIVHIVLIGLEWHDHESILAVSNGGWLLAFLIGQILYLFPLRAWILYSAIVWHRLLARLGPSELIYAPVAGV